MYQRTTLADGRPALVLEACPSSAADAVRDQRLSVAVRGLDRDQDRRRARNRAPGRPGALRRAAQQRAAHRVRRAGARRFQRRGHAHEQSVVGIHETTAHTAPELLLGDEPSAATDVYGADVDAVRDGRRTGRVPRLRPGVSGRGQSAHPGRWGPSDRLAGRSAGTVRPAGLGHECRSGRAPARAPPGWPRNSAGSSRRTAGCVPKWSPVSPSRRAEFAADSSFSR